jgi:hypothetical protein
MTFPNAYRNSLIKLRTSCHKIDEYFSLRLISKETKQDPTIVELMASLTQFTPTGSLTLYSQTYNASRQSLAEWKN